MKSGEVGLMLCTSFGQHSFVIFFLNSAQIYGIKGTEDFVLDKGDLKAAFKFFQALYK